MKQMLSLAFFLKRCNSSSLCLRLNGLKLLSSCENIYLEASDVLLDGYYDKMFAAMLRASLSCSVVGRVILKCTSKSKAIPLQAWTGPEGFRGLRLPDFKTIGT